MTVLFDALAALCKFQFVALCMNPDREERHADKKARRRFLRNGGGLGSDRIYKAFDDTLHFLPALCVVGFPENCLLLRLRHSGVGIQSRFIHGKCHTKSHGYFGKIHTVFLLYSGDLCFPCVMKTGFTYLGFSISKGSALLFFYFSLFRQIHTL